MSEEQVRLLACEQCHTIEPFADYEGPVEYDHLLKIVVAPHEKKHHTGTLFKVPKKSWDNENIKREIGKQIASKFPAAEGLGQDFYDVRDTLSEDALKCWQQHHRNPYCNEYMSDSKRLTPGTAAERKAAGLPAYHSPKDIYLCQYCPVHVLVQEAAKKKAGLYK